MVSPWILILLVPLMRIGVHAMANVGGRYVSLDMLYAEPEGRTRQGRDAQRRRRRAEGGWSSARGRVVEFCVTCVDLLYLRYVRHRQTISMPSSEFC